VVPLGSLLCFGGFGEEETINHLVFGCDFFGGIS
jgi:hypothetical protein